MATCQCVTQSMSSLETDDDVRLMFRVYLVCIWYVIMTRSGVCWIMFHSEFSTWVSKLCWCSAGASWLLRALRDVSDESLLAKYLLLLLLPATQREFCISHSSKSLVLCHTVLHFFFFYEDFDDFTHLQCKVKLLTGCVKRQFYVDVCVFPLTSVWCGGSIGARSWPRSEGATRLPWPRPRGIGARPWPGILLQQHVKQLTGCRLGVMVPRITGVVTLSEAKV